MESGTPAAGIGLAAAAAGPRQLEVQESGRLRHLACPEWRQAVDDRYNSNGTCGFDVAEMSI